MASSVRTEGLESRHLLSLSALGPELPVSTNDPVGIDVAVTETNGSIVVESYGNDSTKTIVAHRYDTGGNLIDERTVATASSSGNVSVTIDDDGNSVIGYDTVENSINAVYFVRLSNEGVLSAPVKVAQGSPTDEDVSVGGLRVAEGFQGSFFVGYVHDLSRTAHEIKMRYYNANGVLRGSEWTAGSFVAPFSSLFSFDLDAMDSNGAHYSAVFEHSDSFSADVYYGHTSFNPETNQGSGDKIKIAGLIGGRIDPHADLVRIAAEGGGATLVYDTEGGSFAKRISGGTPFGDEIKLSDAIRPIVTGRIDGGWITVVDGVATRYNRNGTIEPGGGGVNLGDIENPAIASDGFGNIVVAYEKNDAVYRRRLITSFAGLIERRLMVSGTDDGDAISITPFTLDPSDLIIVRRGDQNDSFDSADIDVISVDGLGGDDTITNDADIPSTLGGGEGNDVINGGSGEDRLYGDAGNDMLSGRDGADRIAGDVGYDSLFGNGGNDRLFGGANSDHMRGNAGRDRLYGDGGNDRLIGGESGDWLYAGTGVDSLYGEGGSDRLYADYGGGPNLLDGGAGNDILVSADDALDSLFGGRGTDTAIADEEDILTGIEANA